MKKINYILIIILSICSITVVNASGNITISNKTIEVEKGKSKEFTITAEHEIKSDNPKLTSLTGTDGAEFTMTSNVSNGSLTADVINEKGSTLPSTGGMGTTLFYVFGAILVLGAGVVLISRRRMEA